MNFVLQHCHRVIQLQIVNYKVLLWENKKLLQPGILKRTLGCVVNPIIGTSRMVVSMNLVPEIPVEYDQQEKIFMVNIEGSQHVLKLVFITGETMSPNSLILVVKCKHNDELEKKTIPITEEHKVRFFNLIMSQQ
jgi:hypothetical protein